MANVRSGSSLPLTAVRPRKKRLFERIFVPRDVYSIGRMGTYRYLDIGMILEQCFELAEKIGKVRLRDDLLPYLQYRSIETGWAVFLLALPRNLNAPYTQGQNSPAHVACS